MTVGLPGKIFFFTVTKKCLQRTCQGQKPILFSAACLRLL